MLLWVLFKDWSEVAVLAIIRTRLPHQRIKVAVEPAGRSLQLLPMRLVGIWSTDKSLIFLSSTCSNALLPIIPQLFPRALAQEGLLTTLLKWWWILVCQLSLPTRMLLIVSALVLVRLQQSEAAAAILALKSLRSHQTIVMLSGIVTTTSLLHRFRPCSMMGP